MEHWKWQHLVHSHFVWTDCWHCTRSTRSLVVSVFFCSLQKTQPFHQHIDINQIKMLKMIEIDGHVIRPLLTTRNRLRKLKGKKCGGAFEILTVICYAPASSGKTPPQNSFKSIIGEDNLQQYKSTQNEKTCRD